jgi:hypothetical protein
MNEPRPAIAKMTAVLVGPVGSVGVPSDHGLEGRLRFIRAVPVFWRVSRTLAWCAALSAAELRAVGSKADASFSWARGLLARPHAVSSEHQGARHSPPSFIRALDRQAAGIAERSEAVFPPNNGVQHGSMDPEEATYAHKLRKCTRRRYQSGNQLFHAKYKALFCIAATPRSLPRFDLWPVIVFSG